MNYCDHKYHLWFFLPRAEALPIWDYEKWTAFAEHANQTLPKCRGNIAVRSQQLEQNRMNQVKFGRIGWNEKSHQKWCHTERTDNIFINTQVWGPSWGQCEKENTPPDFFMAMNNRAQSNETELSFGSVVVLALRADVFSKETSLATAICELTRPILWGYSLRSWGVRTNDSGVYTNAIGDMAVIGLLKTGNWQGKILDSNCLMDNWQEILSGDI